MYDMYYAINTLLQQIYISAYSDAMREINLSVEFKGNEMINYPFEDVIGGPYR